MKNHWSDKLGLIIITFWVGALWATGFAAYIIFTSLPDNQMAGQLAGSFFNKISYLGLFSSVYLMLQRLYRFGLPAIKQAYFWSILMMFLLVLAGHFGIQPLLAQLKSAALPSDVMQSVFASRFKTWHGIASIAYVMQCLLGFVLVLRAR